jgi:hypothetical protein
MSQTKKKREKKGKQGIALQSRNLTWATLEQGNLRTRQSNFK